MSDPINDFLDANNWLVRESERAARDRDLHDIAQSMQKPEPLQPSIGPCDNLHLASDDYYQPVMSNNQLDPTKEGEVILFVIFGIVVAITLIFFSGSW